MGELAEWNRVLGRRAVRGEPLIPAHLVRSAQRLLATGTMELHRQPAERACLALVALQIAVLAVMPMLMLWTIGPVAVFAAGALTLPVSAWLILVTVVRLWREPVQLRSDCVVIPTARGRLVLSRSDVEEVVVSQVAYGVSPAFSCVGLRVRGRTRPVPVVAASMPGEPTQPVAVMLCWLRDGGVALPHGLLTARPERRQRPTPVVPRGPDPDLHLTAWNRVDRRAPEGAGTALAAEPWIRSPAIAREELVVVTLLHVDRPDLVRVQTIPVVAHGLRVGDVVRVMRREENDDPPRIVEIVVPSDRALVEVQRFGPEGTRVLEDAEQLGCIVSVTPFARVAPIDVPDASALDALRPTLDAGVAHDELRWFVVAAPGGNG